MASITIRNLDDDVKTRLRVRAAERHIAEHLAGMLEGCGVEPDHVFLVYPRTAFREVWVVKSHDVR